MKNKLDMKKLVLAAVTIIALAVILVLKTQGTSETGVESAKTGTESAKAVIDSDIIIPIGDITETATFYPAEIKGTKLEVLAVKAADGSIRTAFNTCQVCYSSGRGYYVQEGDKLVCQNCGNRFGMDDVEVTRGGCNPVPITEEYKTVDDKNITVSKDYLTQATVIFENWK